MKTGVNGRVGLPRLQESKKHHPIFLIKTREDSITARLPNATDSRPCPHSHNRPHRRQSVMHVAWYTFQAPKALTDGDAGPIFSFVTLQTETTSGGKLKGLMAYR